MGKAGRKPIVEKSKQREVFMKYADKLLDVKLRDPIFDTIASDLDNLMTPAALYMSLKRNFREFLNTECNSKLYVCPRHLYHHPQAIAREPHPKYHILMSSPTSIIVKTTQRTSSLN